MIIFEFYLSRNCALEQRVRFKENDFFLNAENTALLGLGQAYFFHRATKIADRYAILPRFIYCLLKDKHEPRVKALIAHGVETIQTPPEPLLFV